MVDAASKSSLLEEIEETDEANTLLVNEDEEDEMFQPLFAKMGGSQEELVPTTRRRRSMSSGDINDRLTSSLLDVVRHTRNNAPSFSDPLDQYASKSETSLSEPPSYQNTDHDPKPSPFINNALYASGGLYNSARNGPRLRRSFTNNIYQDPSANMPRGRRLSDMGEVQKESKQLAAAGRPCGPGAIVISLSEAKQRLFNHTLSGVMLKRGFGGFRAWRWRHVVLCGRMLSYFTHHPETDPGQKQMPRGQLEIHKMTRVRMIEANHKNLPPKKLLPLTARSPDARWYGFEIVPHQSQVSACKKGKWMLCASSAKERQNWIDALVASIRLIERTEEPATLRGLGKVFDHFNVRGVLGKGRFGVVRLIHHRPTGQPYALKEIDKSCKHFRSARESIRNELSVLRRIKLRLGGHPFICSTYEVYEDHFKIRIVMEFLGGGDLFDSISARGKYSESSASAIVQRLIKGAQALHMTGIIHRDIKPENVLFTRSNRLGKPATAKSGDAKVSTTGEEEANAGSSPSSLSPRSLGARSLSPRDENAASSPRLLLSPRSLSARSLSPPSLSPRSLSPLDEDDETEGLSPRSLSARSLSPPSLSPRSLSPFDEDDENEELSAPSLSARSLTPRSLSPRSLSPRDEEEAEALSEAGSVKIADFGCSLLLKREKGMWVRNPAIKDNHLIGTPGYIAPEVLSCCHYTAACDVFAIGVIMYIMLVGYPPFWGDDDEEVFNKTRRGEYYFYKADWEHISAGAKQLCAAMLETDPAKRATTAMALQHPWIRTPPSNPIPSTKMRLNKLNELRKHKNDATRESLMTAGMRRNSATFKGDDTPSNGGVKRRRSFKADTEEAARRTSSPLDIKPRPVRIQSPRIQRIGSTSYSNKTISSLREEFSFTSSGSSVSSGPLMSRSLNSMSNVEPPGSSAPAAASHLTPDQLARLRSDTPAVSHDTPKQLSGIDSLFG